MDTRGIHALKLMVKPDRLYRRNDFLKKVKHPDRGLDALVAEGFLKKVINGIYYRPRVAFFGETVPSDTKLINKVLGRSKFLLVTPHLFNSLNLGLTQLENVTYVYNHKRHENMKLGNREYFFKRIKDFPKEISKEFLLIDLLNNLKRVGEQETELLKRIHETISNYNSEKLLNYAKKYGKKKTFRFLSAELKEEANVTA